MKSSLWIVSNNGNTTMDVLNATKVYNLKWLGQHILCYRYFTTIKINNSVKNM